MKYFRENKSLLLKYLMIIITNILLFIFCEYYFRNSEYSSIVTFMSVTIFDYIIYYYKKTKKFVVCIDILCCFIVGTTVFHYSVLTKVESFFCNN